jgi:hypothetical protein
MGARRVPYSARLFAFAPGGLRLGGASPESSDYYGESEKKETGKAPAR